jgi:VWFA-related protein
VFTVTDKNGKGRFITNLSKEDFKVYEDDNLQTVTNFSTETNLPLSIALLVDTSGSIRDRLKAEQEAAIEFFYSVMQRGKDRGLVISFDTGVDVRQDFIDNPEKLAEAIRKIRVGGGTSLYDAVQLAITERLAKEVDDRRKILILISDGDDNSSHVSMNEALELAQRHNVTIYTISTNTSQYFATKSQEVGDKVLKKFADETGGFPFFPPKMNDMAANFADISKELRAQYSIAYRPTKPNDGAYRKLRIEVMANKDFKVRARTGYYSPKPVPSGQ